MTDNANNTENSITPVQQVLGKMLYIFDEFCTQRGIRYWVDGGTLLGAVRHTGFIPWDDDVDICMPRADYNRLLEVRHELPESMQMETYLDDDKAFLLYSRIRHSYSRVREPNVSTSKGIFMDILAMDNYNPDGSLPRGFRAAKHCYVLCSLNRWNIYKKPAKGIKGMLLKLLSWIMYLPNKYYPQWQVKIFKHRIGKWTDLADRMETNYIGQGYENSFTVCFEKDWIFPVQRLAFEDFEVNAPANTDPYLKVYYGDDYMTPLPESDRNPHFDNIIIDDPNV